MKKKKLKIVYEDKYLIVINKDEGHLVISNDKTNKTLYSEVSDYLKKQNKNNKVFIVHRLDRDTSGLVVFAKNREIKYYLQNNWSDVKREYYAIVKGKIPTSEGILKSYLKENKMHFVYSTNKENGKLAITKYKVLKTNKSYSLLKINIKTGRKNQIRVQLNDLGFPIVGDKKYNKSKEKYNRLYLHAYYLEFMHPVTKKMLKLELNYPKEFNNLIEK